MQAGVFISSFFLRQIDDPRDRALKISLLDLLAKDCPKIENGTNFILRLSVTLPLHVFQMMDRLKRLSSSCNILIQSKIQANKGLFLAKLKFHIALYSPQIILCICFTVFPSLQNIRVMAKYYTRVRIARMAELLDLTGDVSTVLFLFLNEAVNKS